MFELCLMKPSVFYYLIVGQFRWQAGGALQYDLTVANSTAFAHITCISPPPSHLFSLVYMQTRHVWWESLIGQSGAKGCSFYFCQNPNKMATMVTIRKLGSGLVGLIKITGSPPRRAGFPFLSRHLACWAHRPPPGELP